MYSMLIADDEEITRNGLCALPLWATLGIRVVACAENGEEAISLLDTLPVHILLTDVKMPCMDGLLLAEHVRKKYPHIRIVFVSGYDDVSYIRRALRVSAVDYILKPVDQHELRQCFQRVIVELDQEQNRQDELQQLLDAYQVGMSFMQENLLNILLTSETVPQEKLWQVAEVLQTSHTGLYYWIAVIRVDVENKTSMHTLIQTDGEVYCFPIDQSMGIYAVLYVSRLSVLPVQRYAILDQLRSRLREQGARRFFAIYADKEGGLWDIRKTYQKLLTVTKNCFACTDNAIFTYEEARRRTPCAVQPAEFTVAQLEQLFLKESKAEALAFLDSHFSVWRNACLTCAADYIPYFSPLLRALDDLLNQYFTVREDDGMDFSQQLGLLANAFCLDDMFEMVHRHYMGIRSMLRDHSAGETTTRITRVKRYIQKHFAQPITVDSLAREVNLAPTYLCLLFREETGYTLNTYITTVRMEKARVLLADENLKLYDVSLAVGYPNASYFTRQFRKHTGMTPSEYRTRCIKGE